MSIELGEAYITISMQNDIAKKLQQAEQATLKIIKTGEKTKQAEINKTTGFWERQRQVIAKTGSVFNNFAGSITKSFLALNAFAGVGAMAINGLITSTFNFAQSQLKASDISSTATESIQGLANAYSNLANIDFNQATSELTTLAQRIQKAKLGIENPMDLMLAGIRFNAGTTLESAVADLRRNLGGRSTAEVSAFLERAGLSSDLLYVIKASSSELEKFNQIPVISRTQLQEIQGAGREFKLLKQLLGGIIKTSQAQIAPYLRLEFERLFKVIVVNKTKIVDFVSTTTKWVGRFITAVFRATGLVFDFVKNLTSSKAGLVAVGSAVALLIGRAKPLFAVLTGLILLLEDIAVWKMTGESPFASFYEGVAKVYNVINKIVPVSKVLKGVLIGLVSASVIGGIMKLASSLSAVATSMWAISNTPFFKIVAAGTFLGFALQDLLTNSDNLGVKGFTENVIGDKLMAKPKSQLNQDLLKQYQRTQMSTNNQNAINNNQQFTINIDGVGKDASNIAKEVSAEIGRNYDIDLKQLNSLFPAI